MAKKNLMIVESPAKAKTIERYLGDEFTVKASYGHVRDLPKEDDAIDVEHNFAPKYVVLPDKKAVIKELKALTKDAEIVWLATDEDREGEAISWHLAEVLGLKQDSAKRVVFNEITKKAVQKAIQNPRLIDQNLVNAQQARRVLDRLVGFQLSPVLWTKVKAGLSAGRVQSVAVRLIVEREREIIGFKPKASFKVTAEFLLEGGKKLQAELPDRLKSSDEALALLEHCQKASFSIEKLETKPGKKSPSAPFTTSTLQQEASRKLSFSVAQTMRVAQTLYESGLITYMRTDSVNLSNDALTQAQKVISSEFGEGYHQLRQFKTKGAKAQEAHEAIRPTDLSIDFAGAGKNEQRLYQLIWKRTLASQMADAKLEKTTATINISDDSRKLVAKGEVLKFDGFLKLYIESKDEGEEEEESGVLPPLNVGQQLELEEMLARERFTKHPPRYTEASLVKKLEELGIGRPSTYAPTISTVQRRNYVVKESREGISRNYQMIVLNANDLRKETGTETTGNEKSKLFPTDLGMLVTDFLTEHFPDVLDYSFTAKVEEEFDEIAAGKKVWNQMIGNFYTDFAENVAETKEHADRANVSRELGIDPDSGKPLSVRFGKYGPYAQIGDREDEEKPRYASLRANQRLETITFEEALELFKLPKVLGEYEGQEIKVNIGRYGPYVQLGKLFCSIPKEEDPFDISLDRAIELIKAKREADANKIIKSFSEEIQVLRGRYGPYLKMHSKNIRIPKDVEPEQLTLEKCEELFEAQKNKPARKGGKKKK